MEYESELTIQNNAVTNNQGSDGNDAIDGLRAWLLLHHTPGLGPAKIKHILDAGIDPEELTGQSLQVHKHLKLPERSQAYLRNPQWQDIEADLKWAEHADCHIIPLNSSWYPPLLKEIPDPPVVLYVRGDPDVLHYPQIAMVGSRNPSHYGNELAFDFAKHLSQSGLVITSGLAIGIDSASHRGALTGNGVTIAVMGTGLDRVYPAINKALAEQILQQGALVSEFSIGTGIKANHFPRRNRIISALSLGTLVVEAAIQSGSLITARQAMEQGRDVFAIPGSIHHALARGCHLLIRDGAKLVETSADILQELSPQIVKFRHTHSLQKQNHNEISNVNPDVDKTNGLRLTGNMTKLLNCIEQDPVSIDTLVERSQLTPDSISSMLVELELSGFITSSAGMYSRLR